MNIEKIMSDSFKICGDEFEKNKKIIMREIKFRIWDTENKEFSEWTNRDPFFSTSHGKIFFWERTRKEDGSYGGDIVMEDTGDRFVLQQYAGLKDSKGKEIYEGDILASSSVNGFRFLYRVEFYEGSFLKPYIFRQMADGEPEVVGRANNNIDFNILTVVGNIFCDEFKMLD